VVRSEARAAQLAYAYLRGRTLLSVEAAGSRAADWKNVLKNIRRFSAVPVDDSTLKAWASPAAPAVQQAA